jgi:hypothetical protein
MFNHSIISHEAQLFGGSTPTPNQVTGEISLPQIQQLE